MPMSMLRNLPVLRQNWEQLLFLHWPLSIDSVRKLIPKQLTIDTFDGQAWIGLVPFGISDLRPTFVPRFLARDNGHELNVRTYVTLDGVPGVWFFSLDADSSVLVWSARVFQVPYFKAFMEKRADAGTITFSSLRTRPYEKAAEFDASWRVGDQQPLSEPGSLTYFLTERYCLYTTYGKRMYRVPIAHPQWRLRSAQLLSLRSTMVEALRLPGPVGEPLVHYAEFQSFRMYLPVRVA